MIIADQDKSKDQCTPNGEMRAEAENNDDNGADMREDGRGVGPEQFDISGSPAKGAEEEIASRAATPPERRLRIPERIPARKQRTETSYDASQKKDSARTLKMMLHPLMRMLEEAK